jgi:hypothetical protein
VKIDPENRRSFVKKSLATSMSVTFAGLIRAQGGAVAVEIQQQQIPGAEQQPSRPPTKQPSLCQRSLKYECFL